MGLDIFLRKGKRHDAKSISDEFEAMGNDKAKEYFVKLNGWLKKKHKTEESAVRSFYRLTKKYDGLSYRFSKWDEKIGKWVPKYHTFGELKELVDAIVDSGVALIYSEADLYYRKVNFLYAFFEEHLDYDTQMAYVDKDDVDKLVQCCDVVLGNKNMASIVLPTQDGFFFGDTEYNKYYFSDVRKVRREFKKLSEHWKEDEIAIIYFSW